MVPASDASALWGASLTGRRGCFERLRFFFCGPPELAGISSPAAGSTWLPGGVIGSAPSSSTALGGVPSGGRGPSPDAGAAVALRGGESRQAHLASGLLCGGRGRAALLVVAWGRDGCLRSCCWRPGRSGGGCRGDMARTAFRLCARGCRRSLSSCAAANGRRTMGDRDRTCDRACDRGVDARRLMMRATGALALGDGDLETGLTGVSHGILGLGH